MAQGRRQTPPPEPILVGGPGGDMPLGDPDILDELPPAPAPAAVQTQPPRAPEPPAPRATIRYSGRELEVDPDLAQVWQTREQDFNRRLSEQGNELGGVRRRLQEIERTVSPPAATDPNQEWNTLLFDRPGEAVQRIKEEAKREVLEQVRQEYQADQFKREFWSGFYRRHEDLSDERWLVDAVSQQLLSSRDWSTGESEGFADAVAQESRARILRLSQRQREAGAPTERMPQSRPSAERPSRATRPAAPAAAEEEESGPASITELLQQRKQARRAAMNKLSGGG